METISHQATKVAFIGMGTMGGGMAKRLEQNTTYAVSSVRRGDDLAVLEEQDIAVAAIKPQQWLEVNDRTGICVGTEIAGRVNQRSIFVSIMAGITIERLRRDCGNGSVRVIRAMLTAAVDGHSLAALYAEKDALSEEERNQIEALFANFGEYMWLDDEDKFADFTALVGSGVGFFGQFTEEFRLSALERKFSTQQAEMMARAALHGAAHQVTAEHSAAELVNRVASTKGTTRYGLDAWKRRHGRAVIRAVIDAAAKRSRQLAQAGSTEKRSFVLWRNR